MVLDIPYVAVFVRKFVFGNPFCVVPFDKLVHEGDMIVTISLVGFHASPKLG